MNYLDKEIERLDKELSALKNNSFENFNIRELIVKTSPPFEWSNPWRHPNHPIRKLGEYHFGIYDGFEWNSEKVQHADDLLLWKLYALIEHYWNTNSDYYRRVAEKKSKEKSEIDI